MVRLSREIVDLPRQRVRHAGGAAPALGSVLVSGLRLRARVRLAFERRDDDGVRRGEGRAARTSTATSGSSPPAARARPRARRRARSPRLRAHRPRPAAARLRQPDRRQGGQRGGAGRLPALSPRLLLHRRRRMVRRAAGDERCDPHGAPLPLAVGAASTSFVDEPHAAVCCDARGETLNLVAHENDAVRRASAALAAAEARGDVGGAAARRPQGGAGTTTAIADAAAAGDAGAACAAAGARRRRPVSREDPAEDLRARAARISRRCSGSKASGRRRCARWRWRPS